MWRDIPIDESYLGEEARERLPVMRHALIKRPDGVAADDFERLLLFDQKTY